MSLVNGCNVEFDAETSRFKKQENKGKGITDHVNTNFELSDLWVRIFGISIRYTKKSDQYSQVKYAQNSILYLEAYKIWYNQTNSAT